MSIRGYKGGETNALHATSVGQDFTSALPCRDGFASFTAIFEWCGEPIQPGLYRLNTAEAVVTQNANRYFDIGMSFTVFEDGKALYGGICARQLLPDVSYDGKPGKSKLEQKIAKLEDELQAAKKAYAYWKAYAKDRDDMLASMEATERATLNGGDHAVLSSMAAEIIDGVPDLGYRDEMLTRRPNWFQRAFRRFCDKHLPAWFLKKRF
jgi:hypothetical protein